VISTNGRTTVGVLFSGGLDSCILVTHLLADGERVQPFYIRSRLYWQSAEERAAACFLAAIESAELRPLVSLELPLTDLYQDHWSVTGQDVPDGRTSDAAVFLPGRNALLAIKAAVWCQLRGIPSLALAPLGTSPFRDASGEFFDGFQRAINLSGERPVQILRPFDQLSKRDVMLLGRDNPLELTFSCIAPVAGHHCGQCNKCAERREAFRSAGITDRTYYARCHHVPSNA
jgi:7-cyano-7-deazaguanine synthase